MNISNLKKRNLDLISFLENQGYSRDYRKILKRVLRQILRHGESAKINSFEELYHYLERKYYEGKSRYYVRSFKMAFNNIRYFDEYGSYAKPYSILTYSYEKPPSLPKQFLCVLDNYSKTCVNGKKSDTTVKIQLNATKNFFKHLQNQGVSDFALVKQKYVLNFFFDEEKQIRSLAYKAKVLTVLKSAVPIIGESLQCVISCFPAIRPSSRNYDFLKTDEAIKFRNGLDENNVQISLRDKAIATIAYYTGIRGTDILNFTIDNVNWEKEEFNFVVSKTGVPHTVPFNVTVGNALWEYLVYERPESSEKRIFISTRKPYRALNNTYESLKNAFKETGVRVESGAKGIRIFRHNFATTMLMHDVAAPVISSLLGHACTESLNPYIDEDVEHLRECGLSIDKYPIAKGVLE
jgi:integrase